MSEFIKFTLLVIGAMLITTGIESVAIQLSPVNTYFVGFFAGTIVSAIINYVLLFEVDK